MNHFWRKIQSLIGSLTLYAVCFNIRVPLAAMTKPDVGAGLASVSALSGFHKSVYWEIFHSFKAKILEMILETCNYPLSFSE